ncbi:hypothetical protein N2152v2_007285 [Parachlorella kessleri]
MEQCGDLDCLVVCGNNLEDIEPFGRMDVYVVLELAGQRFQTKTHTDGGRNPDFNERFRFVNVIPKYATELRVKVMDKNMMLSDKEIGSGRHALAPTYAVKCHDLRLPLVSPKGKSAGELQLLLSFKPYNQTTQVAQSLPAAAPVMMTAAASTAAAPGPSPAMPAAAPPKPRLYPQLYQPANV